MEAIQLSPAEIKLIQIKREQEELAAKEAELKKAAKLEADIIQQQKHIAKLLAQDAEQINAAKAYAKELGKDWEVIVTQNNQEFKVEGEYINPEDPKACDWKREVEWSHISVRQSAIIRYAKDQTFKVEVKEHWVSSRRSYRSSNKGYKMFLYGPSVDYKYQNKAITKAKTINEKVAELIESKRVQLEIKQKQKSAIETVVDKMQALYPDATVFKDQGCEKAGYGRRVNYISYDRVTISFTNGVKIAYKVYTDGSLGRKEVTFNEKSNWELMEKLSKI